MEHALGAGGLTKSLLFGSIISRHFKSGPNYRILKKKEDEGAWLSQESGPRHSLWWEKCPFLFSQSRGWDALPPLPLRPASSGLGLKYSSPVIERLWKNPPGNRKGKPKPSLCFSVYMICLSLYFAWLLGPRIVLLLVSAGDTNTGSYLSAP